METPKEERTRLFEVTGRLTKAFEFRKGQAGQLCGTELPKKYCWRGGFEVEVKRRVYTNGCGHFHGDCLVRASQLA
jgi:hypothetical protein